METKPELKKNRHWTFIKLRTLLKCSYCSVSAGCGRKQLIPKRLAVTTDGNWDCASFGLFLPTTDQKLLNALKGNLFFRAIASHIVAVDLLCGRSRMYYIT